MIYKTHEISHIQQELKSQLPTVIHRDMIELAIKRTPSGSNSKPFIWSWDNDLLKVKAQDSIDQHYLNRNRHGSALAMGCLIASVRQAAHLQSQIITTRTYLEQDGLAVDIRFSFNYELSSKPNLFQEILLRNTYRGVFASCALPDITKQELMKISNSSARISVLESKEVGTSFLAYVVTCETYMWRQLHAAKAFLSSVRFFSKENTEQMSGIPSSQLPINFMEKLMMITAKNISLVGRVLFPSLLFQIIVKAKAKAALKNAHFVIVSVNQTDWRTLIEAGDAIMNAWLIIEKNNYKAQPLSSSTIPVLDAKNNCLPEDTNENFIELFTKTGPSILAKEFSLPGQEVPVWMLRFGKASL